MDVFIETKKNRNKRDIMRIAIPFAGSSCLNKYTLLKGSFFLSLFPLLFCACTVGPTYIAPAPEIPCEWHSEISAGMELRIRLTARSGGNPLMIRF